jgi:hypothetical protein
MLSLAANYDRLAEAAAERDSKVGNDKSPRKRN